MICLECGYLHGPYIIEDIMAEGFMDKFIWHNKYLTRLGDKMVEACKKFDFLHKKRVQLENYKFKHDKLTEVRQLEWDSLHR